MSDFHEEFEGQATDNESVATGSPEDAAGPELETPDTDLETADTDPATDVDADGAAAGVEGVVVDVDEDELTSRAAKADEYLALAQRTKADFDNFRKRAARDAALAAERGTIKLAKELLPALDNLERAISHASAEDPLLEGIKFVQSDLLAALSRAGIESFSPAGEAFDPQLHEAVAQHPQEGVEAGSVLEVYQQGYRLADTVLRPARVLVAA